MDTKRFSGLLRDTALVAIFRKLPPTVIAPLADALVEAGVRAVELTVESDGAYDAMKDLRHRYGAKLLIGAGTLMERTEVHKAVEAGATFLLSPHLDADLIDEAKQLDVPMIPGVVTPTEVVQATRAGADILKLFPAAPLGTSYLKDLLGPFKGKQFIPTGGVTPDNAAEFIRCGAIAVGMGSSLASSSEIDAKNWKSIQQRVRFVFGRIAETVNR